MQQQVDQETIDTKKVLDIAKPPMKDIGFVKFPQLVYKHPKDKAKEHKALKVENQAELDKALKDGYKEKPHIPVAPAAVDADFE
jgi:hypothetical protein